MATAAQGVSTMRSDGSMHETRILALASLATDANAIGEAVLLEDFDEARFRVALLATNARAAGFANVALAATLLLEALGPDDSIPAVGFGATLLLVADALMVFGSP
jgi:hypothetical protein